MASVVQAKNSEEVQNAIEAITLPAGSSRIKRESYFNVSVNAYSGIHTGHEYLRLENNEGFDNKTFINNAGITAPIGIAVSWGRWPDQRTAKKKGGWSFSVFASLIDIGAVTSYRFTNDTSVAKLPTVQLKDILAPGLHVSFGIPRVPVSLNFGWEYGPLLRKVSDDINTRVSNSYTRWLISANVDIPLFNLATKQERVIVSKKR
jgi:hypothetical protein